MKKKCLIILFFLLVSFAFAQAPVDLFDPFYEDLTIWENTGLINGVPEVRPYPLQEIERILNIVIENGTPNQARRAKEYKSRFFDRMFHFGGMTKLGWSLPKNQKYLSFSPVMEMNFKLNKFITGSAHANVSLMNKLPKNEPLPAFQFSDKDIVNDNANIGSFKLLPMINSSIAIGTPEYYFTAGMARTSFGPFAEDNVIVGEQALHSGQFIFIVNKEKFTYNHILLAISASDDFGYEKSFAPKKFLAGHSINYRPLPWISIGILDFMIFGERFEPIYLIPFSTFFIGQSIYDFWDNSLLGLTFSIKPVNGLKLDMVLFADDLGLNDIIRFKSAKWRMAGQFGASYSIPKDHWFSKVDFNYTMVMPYCYSHYDVGRTYNAKDINYQNYTHNGASLGSNLPPNSDRIKLKLKFRPVYGMDINFINTFIRHANINESIEDIVLLTQYFEQDYNTDGSALNHPTVKGYKHAFPNSTPFLKQKTIQYVNQTGLDLVLHFPILKSGGNMQFKIGYTFEANINPGVNKNMFNKAPSGTPLANSDDILTERNRQLNEWRKQAKGKEFNHFLNMSVKIVY